MTIFGVILLLVCVFGLGYKVGWEKSAKQFAQPKEPNPFIRAHKSLEERDKMYEAYKDWCYNNKQLPLDYIDFRSEVINNKVLKAQLEKIING